MRSRKNYLSDVEKDAERYNAEVIHCCIVEKLNVTSKGSEPRILLITNLFVAFYKVQAKSAPLRMDYWCDLESVDVDDSVITFTFGQSKPLRFSSSDSRVIRAKLGELLQRVLTKSEQDTVGVSELTSREYPMNRNGVCARFFSYVGMFQLHMKPGMRQCIERLFMSRYPEVRLPDQPEYGRVVQGMLYALNGVPGVDSLVIPAIKSVDTFEVLSEGFMTPCGFKHIHFDGVSITKSYLHWCRTVIDDVDSALAGLTFSNVKLKEEGLMAVQRLAAEKRFTSLGFVNSIKEKHYDLFLKTLVADVTLNLQMIAVNNQNNLPIDKLIFKARDVYCLSLANCNINIFDALACIAQNRMGKLRFLNLSGNYAMAPSSPVVLIDSLQKLYLDDVQWKERSMVPLWSRMCEKEWNGVFELSMSRAKAVETEWNTLKIFMVNCQRSCISGLTWNFNPVFPELTKFLENSQHIVYLDLSNSFSPSDSTVLNTLANIMKGFEFLTTLAICNDEEHDLRTNVIQVIRAAMTLPRLQNLVVTGNAIGDEGVQVMGELVEKSQSIKCVCFDKCHISSLDTFARFIDACKASGKSLLVEWPEADMNRFVESNQLGIHRMRDFKRDLIALTGSVVDYYPDQQKNEDSVDGFVNGAENPMTHPFEIYKYVPNSFPTYVSERLSDYFSKPVHLHRHAVVGSISRRRSMSKEDSPHAKGSRRSTTQIDFPILSVSNPDRQTKKAMSKLKKQFSFESLGDILAKEDPC